MAIDNHTNDQGRRTGPSQAGTSQPEQTPNQAGGARQGGGPVDPNRRTDATRAQQPPSRPAVAPRPASMEKPGSAPGNSSPGYAQRPGENSQSGGPGSSRPGGQPPRPGEDEKPFDQRVFDPNAPDQAPSRGGRLLGGGGGAPRRPEPDRGPGRPAPRPAGDNFAPRTNQQAPRPGGPGGNQSGGGQGRPGGGFGGGGSSGGGGGYSGGGQRRPQRRPQQSRQKARAAAQQGPPPLKTEVAPARAATGSASAVTEITIPGSITVRELAEMMRRSPIDVIKTLMNYGMMVPITESIDFDTAALVGEELGVTVKTEAVPEPEVALAPEEAPKTLRQQIMAAEKEEDLVVRPPVVTVLGHVDHGKTTLLDAIRETRVVEGEAGGITQHIGAYQVELSGRRITFLDTPGHEAFTAMRARGARVTDIAILVVAADDGVMPQTKEAISHVKAAQIPIIVALNKIDKANSNPDRVKQELADNGVLIEEYGGDTICVPVSAKMRRGIGDLLENILLVADIDPQRANPGGDTVGTVIESRLDKSRGPTATLLVQNGTLRVSDSIVTGETYGKIRAMYDDKGEPIQSAPPATPVQVLGLNDVPVAGDTFQVVADERTGRNIASERVDSRKASTVATSVPRTLEGFFAAAEAGQAKELNLILKADVQGSIEPIVNSLERLGDEKLHVKLLHHGTGNITESDVMLAVASKAIILGFSVTVDAATQRIADNEGVDIRIYNIIYKLIEDIEKALKGMLEPVFKEVVVGHAEIRAVFRVTKVGKVAGCYVTDGEIHRGYQLRVKRAGVALAEDRVATLKRIQEDVTEVKTGFECGITLHNFNDFETGDILEVYKKERVI